MAPWCSGLTCHPVTVEIGGSNPPGVGGNIFCLTLVVPEVLNLGNYQAIDIKEGIVYRFHNQKGG